MKDTTGMDEKTKQLLNQQETPKEGSSETYTQSSSYTPSEYIKDSAEPAHVKHKPQFIEWFVGFSEGDGSFVVNNLTYRISFIITQKDPKVLYFIKQELGFGKVYVCKDGYSRYNVSTRENLERLINIFNGRLKLEKTRARYKAWLEAYTLYYKSKISFDLKEQNTTIDLKSAWLSGFIDAEGCFDAPQRSNRKTFRMRLSIRQKNEYNVLKDLPRIAGKDIKLGYITLKDDVVTYTIDSLVSLKHLIGYLAQNPLKSQKNIAYTKWLRLYRVIEDGGRGKDYEKIKSMAQNINKYEEEDKVQI